MSASSQTYITCERPSGGGGPGTGTPHEKVVRETERSRSPSRMKASTCGACGGRVAGVSWACRGRVVGMSWTCRGRVVGVCRGHGAEGARASLRREAGPMKSGLARMCSYRERPRDTERHRETPSVGLARRCSSSLCR